MSNSTAFIGRDSELVALADAVTGQRSSRTSWLVGGDAGVGKTRLVQEVASRAASEGVVVATGGCLPTARGSLPFVAIIEALRSLCDAFDRDVITDAVSAHPELGLLLPELAEG